MAAHLYVGLRLHAKYDPDGQFYVADVVLVSDAQKRAKAPVKVNYVGFDESVWRSVDDLRSKLLPKSAQPKAGAKAKAKAKEKVVDAAKTAIPKAFHHVPKRSKKDYPGAHDHHHGELHGMSMKINSFEHAKNKVLHWGYVPDMPNGPTHWGCLCKEYALADTGKEQSPIDLFDHVSVNKDETLSKLELKYNPCAGMLENNGHACQLNFIDAGSACIEGCTYQLKQIHFHTPSEHTVNGKLFPMEMHMVHADVDGKLAVIGLLFEYGGENKFLQTFWDDLSTEVGMKKELNGPFDLNALGLDTSHYFRYQGSLTTPPCSESVNWTVMRHAFEASPEQILKFREVMDFKNQRRGNNRPVQPLNARVLQTFK